MRLCNCGCGDPANVSVAIVLYRNGRGRDGGKATTRTVGFAEHCLEDLAIEAGGDFEREIKHVLERTAEASSGS